MGWRNLVPRSALPESERPGDRGYNVRAVDGVPLANGPQVIKDAESFGGQVLGSSGNTTQER